MRDTENEVKRIRSVYKFWGKSGLYDLATFLTFLGREQMIRMECVRRLQLQKGDRVVDIACGTGRNHPYLVEAVGQEGWVVGVDLSPEMCMRASRQIRARGWKNVTVVQGDATEINWPSQSFDGVIGVLGFSVIPDHEAAIRQAVTILKEGSRMVICDAARFRGKLQGLNYIVTPIYRHWACWDPHKDILGTLGKVVTQLDVQWLNGGSIYIASGVRMHHE